jgi:hypothetical protein
VTYAWTKTDQCNVQSSLSSPSVLATCSSSSTSILTSYYDEDCKKSQSSLTNSYAQCVLLKDKSATNSNPNYDNYRFGDCRSSSKSNSNDDEVTLSEDEYGGFISLSLIAGVLLGAGIGVAVLLFCCGYSKRG